MPVTVCLREHGFPMELDEIVEKLHFLALGEALGVTTLEPAEYEGIKLEESYLSKKGGDPRTVQEGTTRTPGWHPEETATQLPQQYAQKPWGGHTSCGRPAGNLPSGLRVSGLLSPGNGGPNEGAATLEPTA